MYIEILRGETIPCSLSKINISESIMMLNDEDFVDWLFDGCPMLTSIDWDCIKVYNNEDKEELVRQIYKEHPDTLKEVNDIIVSTSKGIKYDKGKPRVAEFIQDFGDSLLEVTKVWEFGCEKYGKSNWKDVENGEVRYTNAMLRHFLKEPIKTYDDETNLLHATHLAFNALARLHFIIQKGKEKND